MEWTSIENNPIVQEKPHRMACWIYIASMVVVVLASRSIWPFWSLYKIYPVLVFLPILFAWFISNQTHRLIFTESNWKAPVCVLMLFLFWKLYINEGGFFGYATQLFLIFIYTSLFMVNKKALLQLGDVLSKLLGGWLLISLVFFFAYLAGVPLPHGYLEQTEWDYSFENYYFFLLDNRGYTSIIPRFHSTFLEPSQLSLLCIPLLLTQIGQWNKWWNIVLFIAVILSFSLAGYVLLAFVLFAAAWLKGKKVLFKILLLCAVIGFGYSFAENYNHGDNIVKELILDRLIMEDDGKLSGDDRVTEEFDMEYHQFAATSQIWLGKGVEAMKQFGFGHAGYKVFMYSYGLLSTLLCFLFLWLVARTSPNRKSAIVFMLFQIISFIPHAIPLQFFLFIPLYIFLFTPIHATNPENSH